MISLKLSKSDYRLIWVFSFCSVIWLSLKFWTENHSLDQILFDIPIIMAKTLAAFFLLRWQIQRFIIEKKQYLLFFIYSTLGLVLIGFIDLLRDYFGRGYGWSDLPDIGYIIIHSYYYSAADIAVPFVIIIGKKYFENQSQLAKIKEKQKDAELKLLRAQISPHFLFNNLNTVDALIDSNPTQAKKYIAKLSSLYRYLISTKDIELISLDQEIEMVKNYFYLIHVRFGDSYTLQIKENSSSEGFDLTKKYLPIGALQTVLENVIKHNSIVNHNPIVTTLTINNNTVTVSNNVTKQNTLYENSGTGLQNLEERYRIMLDKNLQIDHNNTEFTVHLPIVALNKN